MATVAVLDTAALYPIALTDTLLRVAATGLFQPVWSADIMTELRPTVLEEVPDARIDKRIANMNQAFPEALVTGYETMIPTLSLKDPDDRHVLAAAITAQASMIDRELFGLPFGSLCPVRDRRDTS